MPTVPLPIKKLIVVEQGVNWSNTIPFLGTTYANTNMTGWTATGIVQKWFYEGRPVTMNTAVTNTAVTISLAANSTSRVMAGKFVYQVNLVDTANNVYRLQEGMLWLNPAVYAGNGAYGDVGSDSVTCNVDIDIIDGGTF